MAALPPVLFTVYLVYGIFCECKHPIQSSQIRIHSRKALRQVWLCGHKPKRSANNSNIFTEISTTVLSVAGGDRDWDYALLSLHYHVKQDQYGKRIKMKHKHTVWK